MANLKKLTKAEKDAGKQARKEKRGKPFPVNSRCTRCGSEQIYFVEDPSGKKKAKVRCKRCGKQEKVDVNPGLGWD